jgi:nucleotide-binding universal stress UspA family protein
MLKQRVLSPQVAMHHKQLVAREAVLLLGVTFIGLLQPLGGHDRRLRPFECPSRPVRLQVRSRLREFVLGGATREILRDPPGPVFVVH